MNSILSVGGKLAIICVVASFCLGLVNAITEPAIERVKIQQLERSLAEVSLGGVFGERVGIENDDTISAYYPLTRSSGTAYILRLSGIGYGGDMDILASFDLQGDVLAVSLMDNAETPGLGKEAERDGYMDKYIGAGADKPIPVSKDHLNQRDVDSITGATITFIGVGEALSAGSQFVKALGDSHE